MRDINEQISSGQHSRAKLKQRLAGGAVLLIVLGIFLPFIFNHSHQTVDSTLPTDNTPVATQAPPAAPAAEQQQAAPQAQAQNEIPQPQAQNEAQTQPQTEIQPQAETTAQSTATTESVAAPAASVQPTAPANVATPAPSSSAPSPTVETTPSAAPVPDKTLSSDQPGLTAPQSETALPEASPSPVPQQTQPVLSSQPEPAAVVLPAAPVKSHAAAARVLPPPARTVAKVAPTGHWVVQVGSFAQPEYAQQLAGKLRASGFPVFTRLGAKQLTRVYIGPIASQQQAQKIQQRVQDKFQISGLVRETRH